MTARHPPTPDNHVTSRLLARYTLSLMDHSEGLAFALAEGNINRIVDLSHKLKGSAGGYGFESISCLAAMIEQESLAIEADISLITDRVEDLIRLCRNPRQDNTGGSDVHHQ